MPNTLAKANLKAIYWCKKVGLNYSSPVLVRFSVNKVETTVEYTSFGTNTYDTYKADLPLNIADKYSTGDLFYINKRPPVQHNPQQNSNKDANYALHLKMPPLLSYQTLVFRNHSGRGTK